MIGDARLAKFDFGAMRLELDLIAAITEPQLLNPYLQGARDRLGVAHLSYRLSGNSDVHIGDANSAFTYSAEWSERYLMREYSSIDPVANFDLACTAPKTWRELQQLNPSISWLFLEAESYGVGRHAVSVPMRSGVGTAGILSLSTFDSDGEWDMYEMYYRAIAGLLGSHIHDRLLSMDTTPNEAMLLTVRQGECLLLLAGGNSVKQIAAELEISGTMVRSHLHSARRRLGASTIASALVKASAIGLLPPS